MIGFFVATAALIGATTGLVAYRRKKMNHK
jgi:hypothetical protein